MTGRIAAVIPCAGFSSRMGTLKPLLSLWGRPLIVRVIETVRSVAVEEPLVVVGHRAEELAPVIESAGARVLRNPDFAQGMYSSIRIGVTHLAHTCDAFFLLPADIPLVRPATFERLAEAWRLQPGHILYPVFSGRRGHPPLIPANLIPSVLEQSGGGGLRAVLAHYEAQVIEVPVADENILFDVDRPEDYDTAVERFARMGDPSPAECEAILCDVYPAAEDIVRHSRQVQRAAMAICRALNQTGAGLDEARVAAAALLHDIAKGASDHARTGGLLIKSLGFGGVGDIIAAHTDLPENEMRHPNEAAVVYLADKLVAKDRFVSLESRFEDAFQRFENDPAARSAIERRQAAAMAVKALVEQRIGLSLPQLLSEGE